MKSTTKSSRAGKILSILAMLALVFSFLPTAAFAAPSSYSITWELGSGHWSSDTSYSPVSSISAGNSLTLPSSSDVSNDQKILEHDLTLEVWDIAYIGDDGHSQQYVLGYYEPGASVVLDDNKFSNVKITSIFTTANNLQIKWSNGSHLKLVKKSTDTVIDEWTADGSVHTSLVLGTVDYDLYVDDVLYTTLNLAANDQARIYVSDVKTNIGQPLTPARVDAVKAGDPEPVEDETNSLEIAYPADTEMKIELASDASTVDEWTADGSTHTTTVAIDTDYDLYADGAKAGTFSVDDTGAAKMKVANAKYAVAQPLTATGIQNTTASVITVPVSKRINASEATPTEGITYTFDFVADAADEAGEYDVPAGVDIPTITLTAAAMSGSTQDLSDTAGLPDASAFGHAGKYTFKVSEVSSATTNWTNDSTEYEINVFVVNDGNGGLKYDDTTPFAIKVNGEKTDACAFVNTYNAVSDLSITKNTVGEFADLTAAFPFSITVNIPEWSDISTVNYTVAPGNGLTASVSDEATVSNHSFTITTSLSNSGNVHITGLPVGSTYSVSETNSNHENSNGDVNVYVPTATYKYSSTSEAAGFTTNTNNVAAGEGSLTVAASGATANVSTMIGDGNDNSVVFTNTLDNPPLATGLAGMGALPYIALIAALAGVAVVFLRARGRRDQEEK